MSFFKKENFSRFPEKVMPILKVIFPNGEKQLNSETEGLVRSFPDLFTNRSAQSLVIWTKTMWVTNDGSNGKKLSFYDMCEAIKRHEENRLSNKECRDIYNKILEQDFENRKRA